MLTENDASTVERGPAASPQGPNPMTEAMSTELPSGEFQTRLERVLRVEWLGQSVASVCWIGSVLAYGVSSSGDWLQLVAASSWLLANIATVVTIKAD